MRMPLFGALVPVVWCVSSAVTALVVGGSVGRQSSTAGIGPFFLLIAALPLAIAGSTLGRLVAHTLGPVRLERVSRSMKWWAPLLLAGLGVAAALQSAAPIMASERAATPRVIVDSVKFQKLRANLAAVGITPGRRVFEYAGNVNEVVEWGEERVQLTRGAVLEARLAAANRTAHIPVSAIDYVVYVDAMPFSMGPGARPALALLITGRGTGRRDLLAVLSESGELIYLELLDRHWNFRSVSLAIASSPQGDRIVVGSDRHDMLVFTPP